MIENEKAMVLVNEADVASVSLLDTLKNPNKDFLCSIPDDGTRAAKVKIYNAVNNASEQLAAQVNKILEIVDVVAHPVQLVDMETGELKELLRVVLIDKNGVTYQAVSEGVVSSLTKIFSIVGTPSWNDDPVKMMPVNVKTAKGYSVLTLELRA